MVLGCCNKIGFLESMNLRESAFYSAWIEKLLMMGVLLVVACVFVRTYVFKAKSVESRPRLLSALHDEWRRLLTVSRSDLLGRPGRSASEVT